MHSIINDLRQRNANPLILINLTSNQAPIDTRTAYLSSIDVGCEVKRVDAAEQLHNQCPMGIHFFRIGSFSRRISVATIAALVMLCVPAVAEASVRVSFHSFNGSVLWGRYPHAFVVFDGTLDATGARVRENFGFSAIYTSQAITSRPAEHEIIVEDEETIPETNLHFTITLSDASYRRMRDEIERWRNHPGRYYDLDERNCIHFVARLAEMAGLQADVPQNFLRRPKAWLNYVTRNNPQLGAREVD